MRKVELHKSAESWPPNGILVPNRLTNIILRLIGTTATMKATKKNMMKFHLEWVYWVVPDGMTKVEVLLGWSSQRSSSAMQMLVSPLLEKKSSNNEIIRNFYK